MKASDTFKVIRDAFNRDCVDISISCDLEDVEICLPLRVKRDTPKLNYSGLLPKIVKVFNKVHEKGE